MLAEERDPGAGAERLLRVRLEIGAQRNELILASLGKPQRHINRDFVWWKYRRRILPMLDQGGITLLAPLAPS